MPSPNQQTETIEQLRRTLGEQQRALEATRAEVRGLQDQPHPAPKDVDKIEKKTKAHKKKQSRIDKAVLISAGLGFLLGGFGGLLLFALIGKLVFDKGFRQKCINNIESLANFATKVGHATAENYSKAKNNIKEYLGLKNTPTEKAPQEIELSEMKSDSHKSTPSPSLTEEKSGIQETTPETKKEIRPTKPNWKESTALAKKDDALTALQNAPAPPTHSPSASA